MNKLLKQQKGFTIIEVVLVLAIAGLIFLIVFLALPALQRSRRDTQRRSDVSRLLSALEGYASNNSGNYPLCANKGGFCVTGVDLDVANGVYIGGTKDEFKDPSSGTEYTLAPVPSPWVNPTQGQIFYGRNSVCNGAQIGTGSGVRDVAVAVFQESGGSYCQDNR